MRRSNQPQRKACRAAEWMLSAVVIGLAAGCRAAPPDASTRPELPLMFDESHRDEPPESELPFNRIRELVRFTLDRPVTLSLRGVSLEAAVRELSRKSGLGIGVTPEVIKSAEGRLIDLEVSGMRARHVLDWITRQIGAHYATEDTQTVFLTSDRLWAGQDRLRQKHYSIGTFLRIPPSAGRFAHAREVESLREFLGLCLRHPMTGHADARLLIDETGSRLTAILPPRGHAKLEQILYELKRPRRYEPTPEALFNEADLERMRQTVSCDFKGRDLRDILADLGRRAKVNIGLDYRRVGQARRVIDLQLGEVPLRTALDALARAADLGSVMLEPDRRLWILAKGQNHTLFWATGELPWDRSVVRSYYIGELIREFGIDLILRELHRSVTPGLWRRDLPVALVHEATQRLLVIHEPEAQKEVARCIQRLRRIGKPKDWRGN
jgi:hypothetical protein